jgi:PIN domain nuclease of toxin-antitoxin system
VKLLLDTHAFIWACVEPVKLSQAEQAEIASPQNEVFVSAASAWEISIKRALGRLAFPVDRFEEFVTALGFQALAMTAAHGILAGDLPRHHDDPFDRMLIAQARIEGLTLVTHDRKIPLYDVRVLGVAGSK